MAPVGVSLDQAFQVLDVDFPKAPLGDAVAREREGVVVENGPLDAFRHLGEAGA